MALPLAFLGQSLGSRVSVSVNDRLPVKRMDMSINDTCNVVVNTLSSYSIKYVWRMWGIIVYSRRRDIDRGHAPQHRVTKPRRVERRKLGVRGTARRQNLFIRYLAHAPWARKSYRPDPGAVQRSCPTYTVEPYSCTRGTADEPKIKRSTHLILKC